MNRCSCISEIEEDVSPFVLFYLLLSLLASFAKPISRQLASTSPNQTNNRQELDSLISNLVGDRIAAAGDKNVSSEEVSGSGTRPITPASTNETARTTSPSNASVQKQSLSFAPLTVLVESPAFTEAEYITYNRGVQTGDAYWDRRRGSDGSISDDDYPYADGNRSNRLSRREKEKEAEQLREKIRQELEKEIEAKQAEIDTASREIAEQEAISARLLSDEESKAVMSEEHFLGFVGRASKVIERALDEEYDILADYAARNIGLEEEDDDGYGTTKGKAGRGIKEIIQFYDERWSKKRMISDLDFSPKVQSNIFYSLEYWAYYIVSVSRTSTGIIYKKPFSTK